MALKKEHKTPEATQKKVLFDEASLISSANGKRTSRTGGK